MNEAVEATNKNIKSTVEKMVITYRDWQEMLPFILMGYQTSIRVSIEATPYSLVYRIEDLLTKVEILSL